jgi:hypothetical protein
MELRFLVLSDGIGCVSRYLQLKNNSTGEWENIPVVEMDRIEYYENKKKLKEHI